MGVDTHKDLHVARAKDELGRGLGEITIPASAKGYRALLSWSRGLGEVRAFGVEGSGCYGVGLARHLRAHGQVVIEVIRPNRQARRLRGKSDPADAEAAAAAVLSGEASGTPKASDARRGDDPSSPGGAVHGEQGPYRALTDVPADVPADAS